MNICVLIFTVVLIGTAIPSFSESNSSSEVFVSPCDQIFENAMKNQPWGMNAKTYNMLSNERNSCLQRELLKQQTRVADAMSKTPECVQYGQSDKGESIFVNCSANGKASYLAINFKARKVYKWVCLGNSDDPKCWASLPMAVK